ncbi:SIR2 family protein [Convivina intestini]|uniref:SIR2-like protein n=1 Tax=Convivina intestini TaxID=1505726 RepID=A0A2U1D7P1_9LACO|nr:SIR2 family protein [Convivina intestini]PVY83703.1 SIR2-like protein [Convivina intestini]CAH1855164.1 hypothetical protein R077811_01007 [Convivina intestini]SDB92215.1 SIR2-like domain-containing protein [Leuconostocaceae bacterium R-53105]
MNFLENLVKENKYPIIFIGSGITKRYFENAPTWEDLLRTLLIKSGQEEDEYYAKFAELSSKYNQDSFKVLTELALIIEKDYNNSFWSKKISMDTLTLREAHEQEISPFRAAIAEIFSNLKPRSGVEDEVEDFSKMLSKARMIITTNYDNLIETSLQKNKININVHVGNGGLFDSSTSWNDLYKIHGSISEPNSIMITDKDYEKMKRSSVLVNAKILSSLTESPIIFLGYSLTDKNVQSLLSDFSDNLPYSIAQAANLVGVVEYKPGLSEITQVISQQSESKLYYTSITTDNFTSIYQQIYKVNQGYSPNEISKFKNAFKEIIATKGQEGNLDTVLTSFSDLNNLSEDIKNKNIVVAFGDKRVIVKIPTVIEYLLDYFFKENNYPIEAMLSCITNETKQSQLPVSKIYNSIQQSGYRKELVSNQERLDRNLQYKLNNPKDMNELTSKIQKIGVKTSHLLDNLNTDDPMEIFTCANTEVPFGVKISYISLHINNFNREKLDAFMKYILKDYLGTNHLTTNIRRMFLAYDFL